MTDDDDLVFGATKVQVSGKAVHRAVQNVLKNEFKLDPREVKAQVALEAEKLIRSEVLNYITKAGYAPADLQERVRLAIDRRLTDIRPIVREVTTELLQQHIQEEIIHVVSCIIKDGMTIKLGWLKHKVKVVMEEPAEPENGGVP